MKVIYDMRRIKHPVEAMTPSRWLTMFSVLALLLFSVGAVAPAGASTINVTANAPDVLNGANGSCALREAITNVNNGADTFLDCAATGTYGTNDTINLPAGTYTNAITGTHEVLNVAGDLDILSSITIIGAGSATTIIDGGSIDNVFSIDPFSNGITVSISGVTIRNGNGAVGGIGGGLNNSGTLSINKVIISGNIGFMGDGILNSGMLTISNSAISGNSGSGIVNAGGTLTVTNSIISGNSSPFDGGGITSSNGTVAVTNSTISRNIGGGLNSTGGGISNFGGPLTVTNSTISGNSAQTGGGISNTNATLTVTNSIISGNTANQAVFGGYGGGIANISSVIFNYISTAIITNSTIVSNSAAGGGIYSTIASNSPATAGGGIYSEGGGAVNLKNTIVANQVGGGDCNLAVTSSLNDLDSDGSCGVGVLSNQNPLLGPLANNGGPTMTHALLAGSPAIDAGDAATCAAAPVNGLDQRGITRPQGLGCDIGAFESGATPPPTVPTFTLGLNSFTFAIGSTLTLTRTMVAGVPPTNADIYLALQLPDGTLFVMQPGGSFSQSLVPFQRNVQVPNFTGSILSYTFTGIEPVGTYSWFAALAQPGTLNVIGTLVQASFNFAP